MPEETKIEAIARKSEFYREITPTSFFGGVRPGLIEAIAITSKIDALEMMLHNRQRIEHVAEICINFTPQQAKQFTRWMIEKLVVYEKLYGDIILDEDIKDREPTVGEEDIKKFVEALVFKSTDD
ncbi:hypothetical protein [Methanothrix sp.]|uniref:hypothetical protein n=1 Tax=Methanothrix sp. TaxID=90426 RepID=UPI0034E2B68D